MVYPAAILIFDFGMTLLRVWPAVDQNGLKSKFFTLWNTPQEGCLWQRSTGRV